MTDLKPSKSLSDTEHLLGADEPSKVSPHPHSILNGSNLLTQITTPSPCFMSNLVYKGKNRIELLSTPRNTGDGPN